MPILAVDDPIYRRLPAFMLATVDKFANLPWIGETAGLFGRVERYDVDGFYGPTRVGMGRALERPLPPPDLIIQDELHLISGPLGTMVGLYETAVDALCANPVAHEGPRPKIVASTATVRRAERQIRGVFGRANVDIFPQPGPDRRDSFFAKTVSPAERHPRTYVGVAAQGRNLKVVLLRTYLALLSAGQKAWQEGRGARNPDNPADPYMTLVGYFNSLRELGGSRRIVEDEVRTRLGDYGRRRRRLNLDQRLFADRAQFAEPRELTSRVSTNEVADTKRRLDLPFHEKERVDVALATNMISVGLDITRLGLMVVLGQPKTAGRVHPGHQPRRARRQAAGPGGDPAQCSPPEGPLPLRTVRGLARELLPGRRGDQRDPLLTAGHRPGHRCDHRGARPLGTPGADGAYAGSRHHAAPQRTGLRPRCRFPTGRGPRQGVDQAGTRGFAPAGPRSGARPAGHLGEHRRPQGGTPVPAGGGGSAATALQPTGPRLGAAAPGSPEVRGPPQSPGRGAHREPVASEPGGLRGGGEWP